MKDVVRKTKEKWCKRCKQYVLAEQHVQRDGLVGGTVLTVLTLGLALPFMAAGKVMEPLMPYQCPHCGKTM